MIDGDGPTEIELDETTVIDTKGLHWLFHNRGGV
jgi:hypothetical protein